MMVLVRLCAQGELAGHKSALSIAREEDDGVILELFAEKEVSAIAGVNAHLVSRITRL